jgi:predicted ester cyclase
MITGVGFGTSVARQMTSQMFFSLERMVAEGTAVATRGHICIIVIVVC